MGVSAESSRRTGAPAPASPPVPRTAHPSRIDPERWANGGGWTRTLLAWPDPARWVARVSVADVERAGPFSVFPGIDRWFAVLEGDGVRLATAGRAPVAVRAGAAEMHAFRGEDATDCELLGSATRDLNIMVRRGAARATVRPLRDGELRSNAALLGCFVCGAAELRVAHRDAPGEPAQSLSLGARAPLALTSHTLAWLENPASETVAVQLALPAPHGWWIEVRTGP